MPTFYVSEAYLPPLPIEARDLAAAKRQATRKQRFQGTHLYVCDENKRLLAQKLHRSALDMGAVGKWEAVAE